MGNDDSRARKHGLHADVQGLYCYLSQTADRVSLSIDELVNPSITALIQLMGFLTHGGHAFKIQRGE